MSMKENNENLFRFRILVLSPWSLAGSWYLLVKAASYLGIFEAAFHKVCTFQRHYFQKEEQLSSFREFHL